MVSERRAARAGLGRAAVSVGQPDWVTRFQVDRWVDEREMPPSDHNGDPVFWRAMRAYRRWQDAKADWFREQGRPVPWSLVGRGSSPESMTFQEWKERYGEVVDFASGSTSRAVLDYVDQRRA